MRVIKNKKKNYWITFNSIKKFHPEYSDKRIHYLLHVTVKWI